MSLLLDISQLAASRGLPFLLIGGQAVISHGFQRSTFDLDLMILQTDQEKWIDLLKQLGQKKISEGPTFLQFESITLDAIPVDLMLVNATTFEKMSAESIAVQDGEKILRTVSLAHLVALKCHAIKFGHSGRVEKDVDDLIGLGKANSLNWSENRWREIILKHGTKELYEKLERS
ncbi:MAG: hypothetical protein ABI042_01250 [Verrucomicrobiota bacterium]